MSILATDNNNNTVQAFRFPRSGATEQITTVAATSVKTAAALVAGFYKVFVPTGATVRLATGVFATVTALATDMPLAAGDYYGYVNAGDGIAIYDAVGANVVEITLMP